MTSLSWTISHSPAFSEALLRLFLEENKMTVKNKNKIETLHTVHKHLTHSDRSWNTHSSAGIQAAGSIWQSERGKEKMKRLHNDGKVTLIFTLRSQVAR